ncbi:MAG: hypothetical protein IJ192_14780 [Clostridia bacterium]|nr:hypothetical protein [Clostridia bacterium]
MTKIKTAILQYYQKLKGHEGYFSQDEYFKIKYDDDCMIDDEIKRKYCHGTKPVEKIKHTDFSEFQRHFGYELPEEIREYFDCLYHGQICGFHPNYPWECLVLADALKRRGETDEDVLTHIDVLSGEDSFLEMCEEWRSWGGDHVNFVPIGRLLYWGAFVVYEVSTGNIYIEDLDSNEACVLRKEPTAESLAQLIEDLEPIYDKFKNKYKDVIDETSQK